MPKEPKNIPNPNQIDETWQQINSRIQIITAQQKNLKVPIPEAQDPTPAEGDHPQSMETIPEVADMESKVQKTIGSQLPMPTIRPSAPTSAREEGSVIVAKRLAEQLGTSPELKAQMRIDERKMAVLQDGTLASLSHFSYRFVYDKVRYWGHITEWWLTGSQGIGGLGRRHILQALANTSGISTVEKAEKPNAVARNLWDRDWKKKAQEQGKVVED